MVLRVENCFWGEGCPIIHRPLIVRLLGTGGRTVLYCAGLGTCGCWVISTRTRLTVGSHLAHSSFLLPLRAASGQGQFQVSLSHDLFPGVPPAA